MAVSLAGGAVEDLAPRSHPASEGRHSDSRGTATAASHASQQRERAHSGPASHPDGRVISPAMEHRGNSSIGSGSILGASAGREGSTLLNNRSNTSLFTPLAADSYLTRVRSTTALPSSTAPPSHHATRTKSELAEAQAASRKLPPSAVVPVAMPVGLPVLRLQPSSDAAASSHRALSLPLAGREAAGGSSIASSMDAWSPLKLFGFGSQAAEGGTAGAAGAASHHSPSLGGGPSHSSGLAAAASGQQGGGGSRPAKSGKNGGHAAVIVSATASSSSSSSNGIYDARQPSGSSSINSSDGRVLRSSQSSPQMRASSTSELLANSMAGDSFHLPGGTGSTRGHGSTPFDYSALPTRVQGDLGEGLPSSALRVRVSAIRRLAEACR